jgi:hypothetical protein
MNNIKNIHSKLLAICKDHRASKGHPPAPEVGVTELWCEDMCPVFSTCPLLASFDYIPPQEKQTNPAMSLRGLVVSAVLVGKLEDKEACKTADEIMALIDYFKEHETTNNKNTGTPEKTLRTPLESEALRVVHNCILAHQMGDKTDTSFWADTDKWLGEKLGL